MTWIVVAFLISCAILGFKFGTALQEGRLPTIEVKVTPGR